MWKYELDILNELYVGETKFVEQLIQAISEARKPYVGKMQRPIKGDRNLIKIGDMIAEEFGFYGVSFNVPFETSLNAMTYAVTMSFDKPVRSLKPQYNPKLGMKHAPVNQLCTLIVVTSGVWFNPEFTDREIAAAILHEVGHSFVVQTDRVMPILETARLVTLVQILFEAYVAIINADPQGVKSTITNLVYTNNTTKSLMVTIDKEISKNPLFSGISNISDYVFGILIQVIKEIAAVMSPVSKLSAIPSTLYTTIIQMLLLQPIINWDRSQEYLSDSFAGMYGLGPEIASFLTKIEYSPNASGSVIEKIVNKIPVIGAINQSVNIPILLITDTVSVHPSTVARTRKLISELEKEVNNSDLSASTKKALKANIECLKENEKKLLDLNNELGRHNDAAAVKASWFRYLNSKGFFTNSDEEYYTDIEHRNTSMRESYDLLDDLEFDFI